MATKIGINGFGRIGRNFFRAMYFAPLPWRCAPWGGVDCGSLMAGPPSKLAET